MKRLLTGLLIAALLLCLTACFGRGGGDTGDVVQTVDENAPLHEQLLAQAGNLVIYARQKADAGVAFQSEYTYGMAQASVSSLRYAIDNLLWLMGEGDTLDDVVGGAPYRGWDAIVAAGPGSPAPFYFEGLLFTIQGEDAQAAACYEKAAANPAYEEQDFFYLRSMPVEALYSLRETVLAQELLIYDEYTPRTALVSAQRTGAEFSPSYHLAMVREALEAQQLERAFQSAVNAVLCDPTLADGYGVAAAVALSTEQPERAMEYINEGLWVFPEDATLNYFAAAVSYAGGDSASARDHLNTAKQTAQGDLAARVSALEAQIGG